MNKFHFCHLPQGVFEPASVVNEMLLCLHRGEGQEQRQEPVAQDGARDKQARRKCCSSKHWEQELVQKEGKHRPKGAVEYQQFEVCNTDKFVYK